MLYLPRGGIPPGACGIPLGAKLDKYYMILFLINKFVERNVFYHLVLHLVEVPLVEVL